MKRSVLGAAGVACFLAVTPALGQQQPTAKPGATPAKPAIPAVAAQPAAQAEAKPVPPEALEILKKVDELASVGGDAKSHLYIEETVEGGRKVAREGFSYIRTNERKFVVLFNKPKTEAGSGYLKVDQNLWSFDPRLGRWERRTERDTLSGTNLRASDMDEHQYTSDYSIVEFAKEVGADKRPLYKFTLQAKDPAAVPFPKLTLWVDDSYAVRKAHEYALSGKLLRTQYARKISRLESKSKNGPVLFATDVKILDEVDKSRVTSIVVKRMDFDPLDDTIFTKAYFEGKSR